VLAAAVACSRSGGGERVAPDPVSLPDLSRASESAKAQLRESYESLTRAVTAPNATPSERAAAYGRMGMLFMAAEYRDEAERCLLAAQALAPDDVRWPHYLAHLYRAQGDTDKAVASFERARALKPDDATTLIWLGESYLDQGRPDAAASVLEQALVKQPQSVAAWFWLGRASLAQHEFARAIGQLERALALDRDAAPVIHYQLAMAYRQSGDLTRADQHVRQRGPGEIHPPDPLMRELENVLNSAVAYEVRGGKALDAHDWVGAAAHFRAGLALAPNEPSLHHKLGTALFMGGNASGAAEEFEAALRLSPTFVKAHYSLGVLMGSSGRLDKAIEHLSAAVKQDPNYIEARLRLADVLRGAGRPADAIAQYDQVTRLDPRNIDGPLGSVMALVALERYAAARDRLTEAMKQYPNQPAFAHLLVRLLAAAPDPRVRDGRAAEALMRDLLAHEERTSDVDEMMAMTMAEQGQFGEAITWQRDAVAAAERAGQPDRARRLAEMLSRYERRQPCRTPWSE
jgi:tetratricopeptide (TPR) repeat protein